MPLVVSPVRKAILADKSQIMDMCEENHRDNGQFALDPTKVEAMIDRAFNGGGAIIGVVGKNQIEGMMVLLISQFWYTSDWCLEEIQNFVRPQFRKSTHAKDMINFGVRCSDELGIPLVIGVVSNERTRAKLELYRRQLGEPVGGYFMYPNPAKPAKMAV
jgi:hypothetical protein